MSDNQIPALARLDHKILFIDREWIQHRLPKENIEIPREHHPDPEVDPIPSGGDDKGLDSDKMGNEQSSSTGPTSSSSTFSFLSNRASRKGKGIVVVNDGNGKAISVEDDEMYKRYKDIPKFLPIIRSTIGKKDIFLDQTQKLQSRPIYKFATRLQEHLHLCAREVQQDQNKLIAMAKKTENSATQYGATIAAKRGSYNSFLCSMKHIHEIDHEIGRIQVILEEIVPTVEHINSLLSTDDQLAPLNLRSILTRTPPMSSTDSSAISTPRHHMNAIEEIRVVDQN